MCKHRNFTITETAHDSVTHSFTDGVYVESVHEVGRELVTVFLCCSDCGLERFYSRLSGPKWLQRAYRQIFPELWKDNESEPED